MAPFVFSIADSFTRLAKGNWGRVWLVLVAVIFFGMLRITTDVLAGAPAAFFGGVFIFGSWFNDRQMKRLGWKPGEHPDHYRQNKIDMGYCMGTSFIVAAAIGSVAGLVRTLV